MVEFDNDNSGMGGVADSMHARSGGGDRPDITCRNCDQQGHFSRDCTEPRKNGGACFNCGQEGHTKAECPNEKTFGGECRHCGKEGHMAKDCPEKPAELCKNCGKEGHKIAECKEARALDFSNIEDKKAEDAWAAIEAADKMRDLDDVREAIMVYVKALPTTTYAELEQAFRTRKMNTYLIASEKEVTDTFTLMDLQGNLERKFTVGYFLSPTAQRLKMKAGWPESPEENLERLQNAGIPVDRKIPKCSNCEKLGHISKSCPEELRERSDKVEVRCVNCSELGHRVRDCPQPRKDRFACRNCGQSGHKADECTEPRDMGNMECRYCKEMGHMAKDCPNKQPDTCRNCGEEGHRARDCTNPANPDLMKCNNCDEMGHKGRDCPKPRDYSRVKCKNCGEMGHTVVRCKQPVASGGDDFGSAGFDNAAGGFDNANGGFDNGPAPMPAAAANSGEW